MCFNIRSAPRHDWSLQTQSDIPKTSIEHTRELIRTLLSPTAMQTHHEQCADVVSELVDNSAAIASTLVEYEDAIRAMSAPKRFGRSHNALLNRVVQLMPCATFAAKFAAHDYLVENTVAMAWSYHAMSVLAVLAHHRPEVYERAFELGVSKVMVPASSASPTVSSMFRTWFHAMVCYLSTAHRDLMVSEVVEHKSAAQMVLLGVKEQWEPVYLLVAHATRSAVYRAGGRPDMCFDEVASALNDDAMLRVYLLMSEMPWDFGGHSCLLGELINDRAHLLTKDTLSWLCSLYEVYRKNVEDPLKYAVSKSKKIDAKALEAVVVKCGMFGDAQSVLKGLVPHLRSSASRAVYMHRQSGMRDGESERAHERLMHRLGGGIRALSDPNDTLRNRLTRASNQRSGKHATQAVEDRRGKCDDNIPLYAYLKEHIVPRDGCERCEVARGADASVRHLFSKEGGYGKCRDVSIKRACTHLEHAITWQQDIEPLVEEFEVKKKQRVTYKRQKALDFMKNCYGVEPVGSAPHNVVTLYSSGEEKGSARSVHFAFVGFRVV